jgi:hypothetical protein
MSSTSGARGNPVMKRRPSRFSLPPLSWMLVLAGLTVVTYLVMNWAMGRIFEPSAGQMAAATARALIPSAVTEPKKQVVPPPPLDLGPDKVDQPLEASAGPGIKGPAEVHRRTGGKHAPLVPLEKPPHGYGTLSVGCVPWCHIYVDGLDTGRNSPVSGMKLTAGRHELRVVNPPSGRTRDIDIDVESGVNSVQRIEFEKGTAAALQPPERGR